MKFFSLFIVQILFLVMFIVVIEATSTSVFSPPTYHPKRSKALYGLTPALRVGRRSKWGYNSDIKRYGKLMAFPRVGRGDYTKTWQNEENYGKRAGNNNGMWFGPRLGRVQKRSTADSTEPWIYYIIFNGLPFQKQLHNDGVEDSIELDSIYKDYQSNEDRTT